MLKSRGDSEIKVVGMVLSMAKELSDYQDVDVDWRSVVHENRTFERAD
jgi:hypothetical protein